MAPNALSRIVAALFFLALTPLPSRGATQLVERRVRPDGVIERRVLPAGHGVVQTVERGRVTRTRTVSATQPLRLIVEFTSPPARLAARHGLSTALAGTDVDRLRGDLGLLAGAARARSTTAAGPVAEITREYTQVFSGAAVTLSPELMNRVRALPYVRGMFPDDTVRANLAESVPLIGADSVRTVLGADGSGVRVGIIDTGIDYNHAAFGAGGYGPGHRVIGGYNFTNDTPDPMDDHGHGTHVAGIVGGDGGGVVGVAPGVSLYAFKVLDAAGIGYTSWILSAFDRVPDPDANPATPDGMQVVNMSFGAPGGLPDDPLAVAVDHLVELGVVCAVAAGNEFTYMGLGTPGTSRRAITVGATTKLDARAWFSSGGPVPGTFDLKPDVCAPGVDILSSQRGGGTVAMSGTSMATPHVAGVAALLRQLHPAWTPDDVKGALAGTALDVGESPLMQGAGRVRAMNAAQAAYSIAPAHLAYGSIDPILPQYTATDTLVVTNLGDGERTVSFPDSLAMAPGAVLHVSPASVALDAHASQPVYVTLVVDNAVTPYPADFPYAWTEALLASSGGETHRVPASFHKAATLTIDCPQWIYQLNVIDRATGQIVFCDAPTAPIMLPPGDYTTMASFFPSFTFVTHDLVHVTGNVVDHIDPAEATVHLAWANVDSAGTAVDCNDGKFSYGVALNPSFTGMNFIGFPFADLFSNPTTTDYGLEWERAATNFYDQRTIFNGTVLGFDEDRTITNLSSALHHVAIDVPATPFDSVATLFFPLEYDGMGGWFGFGWLVTDHGHHGAWTYDQWLMTPPTANHYSLGESFELYGYDATRIPDLMTDWPVLYSPYIRFDQGWPLQTSDLALPLQPFGAFGGSRMRFGNGMPVWRGRFANGAQEVSLDQSAILRIRNCETDMYGCLLGAVDPAFEIAQDGVTVAQDTLRGFADLQTGGAYTIPLPGGGPTEMAITRPFTLRGRAAALGIATHMLLGEIDPDPPVLELMQLLANGEAADSIDFGSATGVSLEFRFTDAGVPAAASARVRATGTGTWTSLATTDVAGRTHAALPTTLSGATDVQLSAADAGGNSITLTWSPGFYAHPGSTAGVEDLSPPAPVVLALAGPLVNPVTGGRLDVAFSLPDAAAARLSLLDVAGREVAGRDVSSLGAGAHRVALAPGGKLASGIYFLRLTHGGRSLGRKVCLLD